MGSELSSGGGKIAPELIDSIIRVQNGDTTALSDIYKLSYNGIYSSAYFITGNSELAKDLTQEAFITCFMKIDTLQSPKSYYAWMWKILKNKHINMLRKDDFDLSAIDIDSVSGVIEDVSDSLDEKVIKDEQKYVLHAIIKEMSLEKREVLILYYTTGLNMNEIADLLNIPLPTVKSRLKYARDDVKRAVNAYNNKTGTKLYSQIAIPVFTRLVPAIANSLKLAPEDMLSIFISVCTFFGIGSLIGDNIKLLTTVESGESHSFHSRSAIIKIKIMPTLLSLMALMTIVAISVIVIRTNYAHRVISDVTSITKTTAQAETTPAETTAQTIQSEGNDETDPEAVAVKSVQFYNMENNPTILEGVECKLNFVIKPDNATNLDYIITSSDENVIKISGDTMIAVSIGEAEITICSKANPDARDSRVFTVIENDDNYTVPTGMMFTLGKQQLKVGETLMTPYVTTPTNTPFGSYYYVVSDKNVISYDGMKITAISVGKTYVNFFRTIDNAYFAGFQIAVTE